MLGIHQHRQGSAITIFAQMPGCKPTELALAHQIAGLGHAGVAEIGGICKHGSQDGTGIIMHAASREVGEAFRKTGPAVNLRQQVSNGVTTRK